MTKRRPHLERVRAWKVVHPLMSGGTLRPNRREARIVLRRLREIAKVISRPVATPKLVDVPLDSDTMTTHRMLGVVPQAGDE